MVQASAAMPPAQVPPTQVPASQAPPMQMLVAHQPLPMPPGPVSDGPAGPVEELPMGNAPGPIAPGSPGIGDFGSQGGIAQPIFAQAVNPPGGCGCGCGGSGASGHKGTWYGLGDAKPCEDGGGLGHERVMFALFDIENSQPESDLRMQFNATYHEQFPDRAEFFWAHIGVTGPKLPEPHVDWQAVDTVWSSRRASRFR